jgi:hypothetical protein
VRGEIEMSWVNLEIVSETEKLSQEIRSKYGDLPCLNSMYLDIRTPLNLDYAVATTACLRRVSKNLGYNF